MIVAYDLRFASDHFAGIGTHAFALLDALLELPGPESYLVIWDPTARDSRHDLERIARHPRVRWVEQPWKALAPHDGIRLGAWLRRERPAIYLSPFYLVPFAAGCPSAITIHDVWPMRLSEGFGTARRLIYRLAMVRARSAAAILTSSGFSRDEIVACVHAPPRRVHAILLGRPPHRTGMASEPPGGLPRGPFALVVGDNRPRKNLAMLARAWATLGAEPPVSLLGVGPVDSRHPRLDTLAHLAGARCVHALGWIAEGELEWLYANAAMVLFPSRYEGFGFPLVEALAHGTPVVAADTPTFREVAGDVGLFVAPDDTGGWARAVGEVAAWDPETRQRMARDARARARELDYASTAARTLAVLRDVTHARFAPAD